MIEALHLVTIANREAIRKRALSSSSGERSFFEAVLAQYSGDVDGAIRSLRRQLKKSSGSSRAVVAEVLAPMLVMRHDNDSVDVLAGFVEEVGWLACANALRALSFADRGMIKESRLAVNDAETALCVEEDEIAQLRVLQRLARASLLVGDFEKALNLAASGAALSIALNAWRAAAANYSVAYNVHHDGTGQNEEARRFATMWYEAAKRAEDASFVHPALVADYEMAVQFADDARIALIERQVRQQFLPQQYTERYYFAYSFAIARGMSDLVSMRTLLEILRNSPSLSRGQYSLCSGLIAVADASLNDDQSARANIRLAISRLGRPPTNALAHEKFARKLARGTIAAACVMIGDDVRADRLLEVSEVRGEEGIRSIPALLRSKRWDDFASSLAGVARVYRSAITKRNLSKPPGTLTPAEFDVLRLFEQGWSAGRIARETDRSINTVYNHSRSILSKLDARSILEAVAKAKQRGLLF